MKLDTRIRRAATGDAAAIGRVYVETWRSAYAGILPDRMLVEMSIARQQAVWRRVVASQRGPETVWVAEAEDGQPIGFASCGRSRALGRGFDGEIFTLYVAVDHQGQGYGRALLRGCARRLRSCGLGSMVVWVLADNPSRFFYEAMGAVRVAERTEVLWGQRMPEIAYGWRNMARAGA